MLDLFYRRYLGYTGGIFYIRKIMLLNGKDIASESDIWPYPATLYHYNFSHVSHL